MLVGGWVVVSEVVSEGDGGGLVRVWVGCEGGGVGGGGRRGRIVVLGLRRGGVRRRGMVLAVRMRRVAHGGASRGRYPCLAGGFVAVTGEVLVVRHVIV